MNKLKLILVNLIILSYFSCLEKSNAWDGFYSGLIIGYDINSTRFISTSDPGFYNSQNYKLSFTGKTKEVVAGWNKTLNNFYIGTELFWSASKSKGNSIFSKDTVISSSSNHFITTIQKKNSYGFILRGGYKINEIILLYAKIGKISSKFDLKISSFDIPLSTINNNIARDFNKHLKGFLSGAGIEFKFIDYLLGRVEFTYVRYPHKNIKLSNSGDFSAMRFKPNSYEIKTGLIFLINTIFED